MIKKITTSLLICLCLSSAFAQNDIFYSSLYNDSSLIEMAEDLKFLFKQAGIPNNFNKIVLGSQTPTKGIVLRIDSTLIPKQRVQHCKVVGNGVDKLEFTASSSFGIRYGVYSYLAKLGYKFYGPGDLWQVTPGLSSPYLAIDTNFVSKREYHQYFGSGSMMPSAIDSSFEISVGVSGSTQFEAVWNKYLRRNNMVNEYDFAGHQGEGWLLSNLDFLTANPCYVAERDNQIMLTEGAVPNSQKPEALQHFSEYIYNNYETAPNLPYYRSRVSVEAADNTLWGNTNSNVKNCGNAPWASPSDQEMTIANYVTNYLKTKYTHPFKTTCYSYAYHADTCSFDIDTSIQILVTNGFQALTSQTGMLNRWKLKHDAILEYSYLNLPGWTGQSPFAILEDFDFQAKRINKWNTLGVLYEGTWSIFSCGLYQNAFQKSMMEGSDFQTNFDAQIDDLFGDAAPKMKELYQIWGNEGFHFTSYWVNNNITRLPYYYQLIKEAAAMSSDQKVSERLNDLKAYFHYLTLYYELANTTDPVKKDAKAVEFLNYMVGIYHRGVVNCSQQMNYVLNDVSPANYNIWWNNWSTPADSLLPFGFRPGPFLAQPTITNSEIDAIFDHDSIKYKLYYEPKFLKAKEIIDFACQLNLIPKDSIKLQVAADEGQLIYSIYAPKAGSIKINYSFNNSYNKALTFVLDAKNQMYSTERTINPSTTSSGFVELKIPAEGYYIFEGDYFTGTDANITIETNGNYFYKTFPAILSIGGDSYADDLSSFTSYNYIPQGLDTIYFYLPESAGDTALLNVYFSILDGNLMEKDFMPTADPNLYYIETDSSATGKFWQIYSNLNYPFSIVNTSNIPFALESGVCTSGLSEKKQEKMFKVYPNPSNGNFTVEMFSTGENNQISVLDFSGRKMLTQNVKSGVAKQVLNCEDLARGIYFIRLENHNGKAISVQKIIIN